VRHAQANLLHGGWHTYLLGKQLLHQLFMILSGHVLFESTALTSPEH
jgi:hypothetical protein